MSWRNPSSPYTKFQINRYNISSDVEGEYLGTGEGLMIKEML